MTAFISPPPKLQFFTNAGVPMASGLLYTYAAGTTTPLVTYTDSSGTIANTNPVILDSRGEASIWLGGVGYKFKLATPANVDVWTQDNIAPGSSAYMTYTPAGTGAVTTTVQAKLRESVSVKDFGAVGDGVTDDTAAIQAAVTYAGSNVILFPPGTYKVASPYAAPDGTKFYLKAGASFITNTPTGASVQFEVNQGTGTAGSVMKVERAFEYSSYPLSAEGGIWTAGTYTYFGLSKEMTAATTTSQGNGPLTTLFSFANNNGATGDVVAVLGDAVARQSNGTVFGANFIARNAAATTGTKLVGLEIDVEPALGTTISSNSIGIAINIFSIATSSPAIQIGRVSSGTWLNGIVSLGVTGSHFSVSNANATTSVSCLNTQFGIYSTAAIMMGTGASQAINFGGSAFGTSPFLYGNSSGDLVANTGTSGFVVFSNPSGAQRFTFSSAGVLNIPNAGAFQINSTQVVGVRDTGFSAFTGTTNKATVYATGTVTLIQLAERVAALQASLTTHGLIGP